MDLQLFNRIDDHTWRIEPTGAMRVPGIIYASVDLIRDMDAKVHEQVCNVASLPGIVTASYAMPDAHWGYGFPIGGVAAFDPAQGGVISAGGVGFDISCGVRSLHTGLKRDDIEAVKERLAEALHRSIPAGVGSTGAISLSDTQMDAMLAGGAEWAVDQGYGHAEDLLRIEEHGRMAGAEPERVSDHAKRRQRDEMGTLGSGNHYLEVQHITDLYDADVARAFGIEQGDAILTIHCGSRGLGHQIGTEFLRDMAVSAEQHGITLPDRELACAPIESAIGQAYLGAMRAGVNCALANRQIITHLTREAVARVLPKAKLDLLYDVSHNTCKVEEHAVEGRTKPLFVHRKGATRAFGPGHPELPADLRDAGQPVLIGGSMGTASYILTGTTAGESRSFSSSCHGAGRAMSRHQAKRRWRGREVVDNLAARGIIVRSNTSRGVAEEAPGAYKDVSAVIEAAHDAGISKKVARLEPLVCIKG
ncbi:MAG: RtcB family protein [Gammaproteobacteria bacterium]|jgi:tRNA-splicing ligase RtcB